MAWIAAVPVPATCTCTASSDLLPLRPPGSLGRRRTRRYGGAHRQSGGVMASMRTTYRGGRGTDSTSPSARPFVWVSLRDPSPGS
jgi:hypothetical protein